MTGTKGFFLLPFVYSFFLGWALVERGPQLVEEGVVAAVEVAEDGLDSLGGLVGVVEGDAAVRLLAVVRRPEGLGSRGKVLTRRGGARRASR